MTELPIDLDIIQKHEVIPVKLAELTYTKPDVALELMRIWGEDRLPVIAMFELIMLHFKEENKNDKTA